MSKREHRRFTAEQDVHSEIGHSAELNGERPNPAHPALEFLRGSAIHYSSGSRHNWQVVLIESGNFVKIG